MNGHSRRCGQLAADVAADCRPDLYLAEDDGSSHSAYLQQDRRLDARGRGAVGDAERRHAMRFLPSSTPQFLPVPGM